MDHMGEGVGAWRQTNAKQQEVKQVAADVYNMRNSRR